MIRFNALNNSCVLTARCEPKRHTLVNSWLLIYLKLEFLINDKFFATSPHTLSKKMLLCTLFCLEYFLVNEIKRIFNVRCDV
ncbi:hypothetical protein T07_9741 [Trichinella nelsoni]|uniref:Uncharacterized protein n=1 Tax=Trichinella nelsoni TaxID=6336 RepID=A0A0V0S3Z5_9BILA|nr:hypothetical protein T07_9741 [Trichinella nelsoni]